jgi:geranylgeranyl reductase family protein
MNAAITDVLVVGAGPAGSAAASTLARAGRSVMVVDKATFPRDKCCGDGLTTLALRELESLGLRPAAVDSWHAVDAAWLRAPSGREVRVPLPTGAGTYAAVATRLDLDQALVDVARSAGAKIHDGHAFAAIDTTRADHVRVAVEGVGDVLARYVVAADGMWSPVRKALGLSIDGYRGEWHALRQYASGVTGPARDRLYVWFEPDLLPGYAWSFPLPGGRVNVGFGVLRGGSLDGGQVRALWHDLLRRPFVREALGPDAHLDGRVLAWPIPARIDSIRLVGPRTLFVGDAAAATDVLTGEGIGQALLTGRLAAEAIIAAGALQPGVAAAQYERAARDHLAADHALSKLLGRALAHRRGAEYAIRIVGASGTWGRRNFARWMFEDEPRAIALTPRRWHRGLLRGAGAYVD